MPGGFPLGLDVCNGNDVGSVTGTSTATAITPSASANTKGSYSQLIASTPSDTCYLVVNAANIGNLGAYYIDIAVGAAASEQVIISNLMVSNTNVILFCCQYGFPVSIPAGTRISARAQAATASDPGLVVSLDLFDGAFPHMEGCSGVDSIGAVTASTQGTTISSGGSANTKGSYTQLVASTSRDYLGFWTAVDNLNLITTASSTGYLIDVAIGGSGSEQIILPNMFTRRCQTGQTMGMCNGAFYPINIPAGTRIAARAQSTVTTSPSNSLGLTLYGIYQ